MVTHTNPAPAADDLDAMERQALLDAAAEADAQIARGESVDHEVVRDWLLDLARGVHRPPPEPIDPRRR